MPFGNNFAGMTGTNFVTHPALYPSYRFDALIANSDYAQQKSHYPYQSQSCSAKK